MKAPQLEPNYVGKVRKIIANFCTERVLLRSPSRKVVTLVSAFGSRWFALFASGKWTCTSRNGTPISGWYIQRDSFDRGPKNGRAIDRPALLALNKLGLINEQEANQMSEWISKSERERDAVRKKRLLARDAEELGFKLVPLRKPKRNQSEAKVKP